MTDPSAHPVTVDQSREFERFVPQRRFQPTVAISPDGATVAYSANDGGQYNLWLQPLAGGAPRQLTAYTERSVRDVAWSPDGATLAFAADQDGDEQYQIYVVDTDGDGEARRVSTTDKRQHGLAAAPFSADGKTLIYSGNDRDESAQDMLLHDLASDIVRRVASVPGEVAEPIGVSPDGRWLLASISRSNTDADCAIVDLSDPDGGITLVTAHEGEQLYRPAGWLPDSSGFYVTTDAGGEFLALARVGLEGDVAALVEPDWDVEHVKATDDGSTVVWVVNESGTSIPYVLRIDDGGVADWGSAAPVDVPDGVIGTCDVSPDGTTLVALFGTGTRPTDLVAIELAGGRVTYLTDSRPPALTEVTPVAPQLVDFETHDGRRVPAWLYQPAGAGPHPVVLSIHGGPESQERAEYTYSGLYQFLLSKGIGVLAPNVRGSTGYGVSYQKLIHRDWGGDELRDFEHAVAYLRTLEWVDSDRIAVFGGSFGGFATLSCVSRLPDLFAAGVSIVGPSNLVTLTRSVPPTWRPLMASWVGDPDDDHDMLMERSPITYVDQITAPLMVIQGANDPRVVKAESDQIVEALRARGVEVRYDVYDDEGHGFTKRSNEIKAIADVADFLLDHLGG
jgi:dipeptidyl aminopeptidase/acylaminoacyl peptidase